MFSRRLLLLLCIGSSLASLGAGACGSSPPRETGPRPPGPTTQQGPELPPAVPGPSEPLPVPALAERRGNEPPRHTSPAPPITSLDEADRAATKGYYAEAERFYREQTKNKAPARAQLGLARVLMETGRYAEAGTTAEQASREASLRVAGETLRIESLLARGDLEGAERGLTALVTDPRAYRANVLYGRLLARRGRAAEAEPFFMRQIEAYNDESIGARDGEGIGYVAMSAWGLGSHQDANDAFQQATRAAPDRQELELEWAEMFLEKYDTGHAAEGVRKVLEANPASARALSLMARIQIQDAFDFATATLFANRALEINPNDVDALVILAGMELRDMSFAAADERLDRALAIDANDLDALSVRAAVRFLAEDRAGFERAKREVLTRNRSYTRMYQILSEFADWEHRYPEIVAMAREAVTLNPSDAVAHATLGLNLLRTGDETHGLESLRESWQRDRFNVHVFNTLNLYDDVIRVEYEDFEAAPLHFRMHKNERPVLERYVPRTLNQAWAGMRQRYGFTPEGPVRVEMYASNEHFSVRTSGLPNIGVQGVCFGKVVTAISPQGGPFNWGQITWHELAHVFHIQLSRNRVPRWFTEGLAEYETIIARPEWRREEDHRLYQALVNGRIPPIRLLNRAFTHAESGEDVLVAYYASSQLIVYLAERFGFDKLVAMLRGWGEGLTTPDVVQRALGLSIDELDRDFVAHTRQRLAARARDFTVDVGAYRDLAARRSAAEAAPTDATAQAAYGAALLFEGDAEQAKARLDRALAANPNEPVALYLTGQLAMANRDSAGARIAFRKLIEIGKDGYELRLALARLASGEDRPGAITELRAATRIDADRAEAWQGLLELQEGNADAELEALRSLVRIDQHDRESAAKLLAMLVARSEWAEVVQVGENTIFVDPESPELHRVLAEGYLHTNRARDALTEIESAVLAAGAEPGPRAAPIHITRARVLTALNRARDARQAADEAIRLDPAQRETAEAALRR